MSILSLAEIRGVFEVVVESFGGKVNDVFCDDRRLFARSVLPKVKDVAIGDGVKGGVALRATEEQILLHPYTFRLVCSNGAIMAQATQTVRVEQLSWISGSQAADVVAEAIRGCCTGEAFETSIDAMRSADLVAASQMINLLPFLRRWPEPVVRHLSQSIAREAALEARPTRFGLMNAVTAVARETQDPELRWELEQLGGRIATDPNLPLLPHGAAHVAMPVADAALR